MPQSTWDFLVPDNDSKSGSAWDFLEEEKPSAPKPVTPKPIASTVPGMERLGALPGGAGVAPKINPTESSLLGSLATGARTRAAEKIRQDAPMAMYGDPMASVPTFITPQERKDYLKAVDQTAASIEPTPEAREAANRTVFDKSMQGLGSFVPDAPEYLAGGGFARKAITSAAPKMASSRILMPALASQAADTAMDIRSATPESYESGELGTRLAAGLATNVATAPASVLPGPLRAALGGGVGYGVGRAMGMSDEDAMAAGATQGVMSGVFGAEQGATRTRDIASKGLNSLSGILDKTRNQPWYQDRVAKAQDIVGEPKAPEVAEGTSPAVQAMERAIRGEETTLTPKVEPESPKVDAEIETPTPIEPEAPLTPEQQKKVEARNLVESVERGETLNANPVQYMAAKLTLTADKVAERAIKLNDAIRDKGGKGGLEFRTDYMDKASALHDLDRKLNTPYGQGAHARFQTGQNIAHRIEIAIKNKLTPLTQRVVQSGATPQAKRIKLIDAQLEEFDNWKAERDTLLFERESLEMQRDTPGDVPASVPEPGKAADTREARLADIDRRLEALGDDYKFARVEGDDPEFVRSREDLIAERQEVLDALEPQQRQAVEEYSKGYTGLTGEMLDIMTEAGILSPEQAAGYKAKRAEYVPFYRIAKFYQGINDGKMDSDSPDNVSMGVLLKERKTGGSELEIMDPTESALYYMATTMRLAEQNQMRLMVADMSQRPELAKTIYKVNPMYPGALAEGYDTFFVRRNGKTERYAAPKEVAETLKYQGAESADIVTKMMAKSAGMLRAGATMYSIPFIPRNFARDMQNAYFREGVKNPMDFVQAFASIVGQNAEFERAVNAGVTMGGYIGSVRDFNVKRADIERLPTGLRQFWSDESVGGTRVTEAQGVGDIAKLFMDAVMVGPRAIADVSEVLENVPRVATFRKKVRDGASDMEAAYRARNSTVDFRKIGRRMKTFNMIVPFINARAQGVENMRQLWATDPVRAAGRTMAAGIIPQVAATLWNMSEYPDVLEKVRENDTDRDLILITGRNIDPETGKYTQVLRIPKSEALAPFMNITERYLKHLKTNEPLKLQELAVQVGSDLSPVSFAEGGEFSLNQLLSGTLPPIAKSAVESATNTNLHTGRDIDSRTDLEITDPDDKWMRRRGDTPLPVQQIAKTLGVSSNQVDNFIGTNFATGGRQLMALGDYAMRALGAGDQSEMNDSLKRISRAFQGSLFGVYPELPERDRVNAMDAPRNDIAVLNKQAELAAEKIVLNLRDTKPSEREGKLREEMKRRAQDVIATHGGEVPPSVIREYERLVDAVEKRYESFSEVDNERRARSLYAAVQDAPDGVKDDVLRDILGDPESGINEGIIANLMRLKKGDPLPSTKLANYFRSVRSEARARYVADQLEPIIKSGDVDALDREMKVFAEYGIMNDNMVEVQNMVRDLLKERLANQDAPE